MIKEWRESKMKKELVLKEWQADIIKDKAKIIMVNTSRGGSKTKIYQYGYKRD
jgi:hypothetical protein